MAKLKIKGYQELVDVPNQKAKDIKQDLMNIRKTSDHFMIDLGTVTISTKDISAIILEEDYKSDNKFKEKYLEFISYRNRILNSDIQIRVDNAIKLFKTLFRACANQLPALELISQTEQETKKFLENNLKRLYPDLEIWQPFIQPYSTKVNIINLKVIEALFKCLQQDKDDSTYKTNEEINTEIEIKAREYLPAKKEEDFTIPW